ncbi:phosphotransferase [Catellatospora sp. TT07R-123]|uniref:phosphotransferase enzyme family protein n=1 Tax=Catellatospora sp. TT07R-123 TaxID=2733863 RepID=UPI001B21083C|nr:phosphotransferase [Catellatospora sp. TT07R-123]GHJ45204.1 phosphotransferase [Catellatospora sp. TT07R-123]
MDAGGKRFAGGVNVVERIGDAVHRPAGPWTPAVHALLRHLRAAGFTQAPAVRGTDAAGREVLDFVAGEVPDYPLPGYVRADRTLVAVGELLRRLHDASAGFTPPPGAVWQLPPREPAEVVCHGDLAPYNCVFRDGELVAAIDFDTAHPGPRLWDLAYTAYRFVPLSAPENPDFTAPIGEQVRRLRLLADAYGLDAGQRGRLPETAARRVRALAGHIRAQAALGHPAFTRHLAEGHADLYEADAAHLDRQRDRLAAA